MSTLPLRFALLAALSISSALAQLPEAVAVDTQMAVYDEFAARFSAGDYAAALPLAQRVIELTPDKTGNHVERAVAYNNLGATQFRLGDLAGAEASYQKSLELLEFTQGISSRRMITPLAGLGQVYAARDQHLQAAEYRARAIAVSRRADGLFNLGQAELIGPVVESYLAINNLQGVDYERRYAVQLAERNFGNDDPRLLAPLSELAVWYETTRRYAPARALYLRMSDIAANEGSKLNETLIYSLLGIGRTYRLQFMLDPESLIEHETYVDRITGQEFPMVVNPRSPRLDRGGLRSLEDALDLLKAATDPPPRLLANTYLELGDWQLVANRQEQALAHYAEAWKVIPAALAEGERNPLVEPRLVFYRPPDASMRHRDKPVTMATHDTVEITLDIDASGRGVITRIGESVLNEYQLAHLQRAFERALFSPRFEDGQAVATVGARFVGEWYRLIVDEASSGPPDG